MTGNPISQQNIEERYEKPLKRPVKKVDQKLMVGKSSKPQNSYPKSTP
jgi:hypothetical protein